MGRCCLLLIPSLLAGAARPGLQEEARSEADALRIGWPQLVGPYSSFQTVPNATPLIDDLSKAKRLWESECRDLGRAKGGSQAYRRVEQFTAEEIAKMGSHPGNWAGPVVAEGMVFCASWRPFGDWVTIQGCRVRLDAEDFIVAIDALSGRTRWLTAEPGGLLKGGGKRQGFQVGPVVHKGVVYSLGSTARLFAHDAATGRKLWESDDHPARADSYHGPKHGGRHPWTLWSVAGDTITRLPGRMDLVEFTNGYEVTMESPLVAGLLFERTEQGGIVCCDLRAR